MSTEDFDANFSMKLHSYQPNITGRVLLTSQLAFSSGANLAQGQRAITVFHVSSWSRQGKLALLNNSLIVSHNSIVRCAYCSDNEIANGSDGETWQLARCSGTKASWLPGAWSNLAEVIWLTQPMPTRCHKPDLGCSRLKAPDTGTEVCEADDDNGTRLAYRTQGEPTQASVTFHPDPTE